MSVEFIFYLLVGIITFEFLLERTLHWLNSKSSKSPIPESLDGIYDEESYRKSQDYMAAVSSFSSLSAIISFVAMFIMLFFGGFGWLDSQVKTLGYGEVENSLIFFAALFIASDILGTPFSLYRNFVIEAKFGFNKMTMKTYWMDKLKSIILSAILGGGILFIFLKLVDWLGSDFWIYFWGVMIAFTFFANILYTSLILPLFNKLQPMEDGELKSSIQEYSDKVGFPLQNLFVMDGSKRSSKGNAFFSGLGKRKKVVLFDTLIEKHTTEELTAVFAHEVGHYKKKHIIYSTIMSIGMMGGMLFLLSLMIDNKSISMALGGGDSAVHLNLLAFGILYSPISNLLGIMSNVLSRKNEYEADAYARDTYKGEPLQDALKKMSKDHLSNLTPHPAYVFMHYSHPTLLQRVNALSK